MSRCTAKAKSALRAACALATLLLLAGCGAYPRDADGASAQAAEDGMHVGASHDPPWVRIGPGGSVGGPDAELMQRFAAARGYRLDWVVDGHDALMHDLERARLHAVVGGHRRGSPWEGKVGWSRALPQRAGDAVGLPERRVALPPGQSAWQLAFDRYLLAAEGAR